MKDKLREAIIKANPSINNITAGQIKLQELADYFHEAGHKEALRAVNMACDEIGRPITLADVLIALNKSKNEPDSPYIDMNYYDLNTARIIFKRDGACVWDLTKTYKDQSKETKDFLEDLLT